MTSKVWSPGSPRRWTVFFRAFFQSTCAWLALATGRRTAPRNFISHPTHQSDNLFSLLFSSRQDTSSQSEFLTRFNSGFFDDGALLHNRASFIACEALCIQFP